MKLLVSHFGLYKKGGWGRTFEQARGLAKLGHDVTLLCSLGGFHGFCKRFDEDGVRIVAFHDIIPLRYLSAGYGFLSLLSRAIHSVFHSYDVCLSNSHRDNAFCPCVINRFFHHGKIVTEWWDNFLSKQDKIKTKHILNRFLMKRDAARELSSKLASDAVVALSSVTAKRAIDAGVPPSRVKVVRGGCDIGHISYLPLPVPDLKMKKGIPEGFVTFGLIGDGDLELDDMGIFLEAMEQLGHDYRIKLLNYGKPFRKLLSQKPEYKDLICEMGWVDYYGDNSVLSATDVFVLIKKDTLENRSGWPNKLGDYLACGRPVITNPYGELIPFMQEWDPGFIVVDYSKESIMEGIKEICEGRCDLRELGEKNHRIALSNSWQHRAGELESIFMELM